MKPQTKMTKMWIALGLATLGVAGCNLGGQIIEVGQACRSDADCSDATECVAADSANADKVCMPFDDDVGASG